MRGGGWRDQPAGATRGGGAWRSAAWVGAGDMAVGGWWGREHSSAWRADLLAATGGQQRSRRRASLLPCRSVPSDSMTSMGRLPVHRTDQAGGWTQRMSPMTMLWWHSASDKSLLHSASDRAFARGTALGRCAGLAAGGPHPSLWMLRLWGSRVMAVVHRQPQLQERHRAAGVTRTVRWSSGGPAPPAARRTSCAPRLSPCTGCLPQTGAPSHDGRVRSRLHGGRKRKQRVTLHPGRVSFCGRTPRFDSSHCRRPPRDDRRPRVHLFLVHLCAVASSCK